MTEIKTGWYNSRSVHILTHIGIWVVVLALPYLLDSQHDDRHLGDNIGHGRDFFYLNFFTNFLWIAPFYLNAYWLTPRLLYPKKYVLYAGALIVLSASILGIHAFLFKQVFDIPHFSWKGASGFILPTFLLVVAISTAFRVVRDKVEADRLAQLTQEENLKTELSFLRSQINPHFIFNILNNLVALERMKSEELGPTILKLSALMQYMLYETDEEKVELSMEVDYLQSYIDLQRQRFGEKVHISVSLEKQEGFYEIEPMLLIPFVENAFKHGVGLIGQPAIYIDLHVRSGVLYFGVKNKYNAASTEIKDKTSGIGLTNVKRRLNLLYGQQQVLRVTREQEWFIASLELNLH